MLLTSYQGPPINFQSFHVNSWLITLQLLGSYTSIAMNLPMVCCSNPSESTNKPMKTMNMFMKTTVQHQKNSMKTINFTIKKPPYSTTISICNFSPIFPISGRQLTSRLRKSGAQDKTGFAFMVMTCTLLVLLFMAAMRRAVVENCAANCVMWDGKNRKIRREMMEIYGTYMEICGKYLGNTWEMMDIYIYMG